MGNDITDGLNMAMMIECAIQDRKTALNQYRETLTLLENTNHNGGSDKAIETHKVLCQTVQRQIDHFTAVREAYTNGTFYFGIVKEGTANV